MGNLRRSSLSPSLGLFCRQPGCTTRAMFGFARQSTLNRLEERVEKLEIALRQANLDFDELYAKCRKLLGRVVKERATIEAAQKRQRPRLPTVFHHNRGGVV